MTSNYGTFGEEYFRTRHGNDPLRQLCFAQERNYLQRFLGEQVFHEGSLLDVGCSTGEFIVALGWNRRNAFGMEISEYARGLAQQKGIRFDRDLSNAEDFFDLVVFRGTIQYLPNPFEYITRAAVSLKRGGFIAFLATPNANSIYYRLFKTLPFLEEHLNYLIPCATSLVMNLRNAGLHAVDVRYPYLRSPYARFVSDHFRFVKKLLFRTSDRFAFWGSSMTILARKP